MKAVKEAVLDQSPCKLHTLTHKAGSQTHNLFAVILTFQALSTSFSLPGKRKLGVFSLFLSGVATVAQGPWLHDKDIPV